MSMAQELAQLHVRRQSEMAHLRAQVEQLTGSVATSAPRQWVQKHPYLMTAGAAVAGFAAAKLMPVGKPKVPETVVIAEAPTGPTKSAEMMTLIATLAQQFFDGGMAEESEPARLAVGDAGAVVGAEFPPA